MMSGAVDRVGSSVCEVNLITLAEVETEGTDMVVDKKVDVRIGKGDDETDSGFFLVATYLEKAVYSYAIGRATLFL